MKTLIIANPVSGNYNLRKIEKVKTILSEKFGTVSIALTERAGHATELAANTDADIVIAAGGDGLANETAKGVIGSSKLFSVLPFGTANVFCCEHGIGLNPIKAAIKLSPDSIKNIHVGYIDSKLFLLMVGFGFDAETVGRVEKNKKKHTFKKLSHMLNGYIVLLKNKFVPIILSIAGRNIKAYHVIISISSCYGGKFKLGKIQPDTLNIFFITSASIWSLFTTIISIGLGFGFPDKKFTNNYAKVQGVSSCQIDGEFIELSKSSVFVSIKRNAIKLIC